jgi:chaperonin cofactor prefoldin
MPSEFDQLMSQCEKLATQLKTCRDPKTRIQLLKEMKIALDAANRIAFDFPIYKP